MPKPAWFQVSGFWFQVKNLFAGSSKNVSDARRAKIDERRRTEVVRWSEAIEAQRSR